MDKTSLGDRMKNNYENRYRLYLPRRIPVMLRLDGKAFHTLTRKMIKPFDEKFHNAMVKAAMALCEEAQGVKLTYIASDEITVLLTDFDKLTTEAWFNYNIQKMSSIAAAVTSVTFSKEMGVSAVFDCRAFSIPKEEVVNNLVWRQQDWVRNSISMLAQSLFSHKELHQKKQPDMHEMLYEKGINWNNCIDWEKNGTVIMRSKERQKDKPNWECSHIIFKQNRQIVEDQF